MKDVSNRITRNNHYVPQFYLKNWSDDGKKLWTYCFLVPNHKCPYWKQTAIKSTAVWNDFYTRTVDQEELDDFEQEFNRLFETPIKHVFDRIMNNEALTEDENRAITDFVFCQWVRTPAYMFRRMNEDQKTLPKIIQKELKKAVKEVKRNPKIINQYKEKKKEGFPLPISAVINREEKRIEVDSRIGKGMYLFEVKYALDSCRKHLKKYEWHVIEAADGIEFPTSDDPVICLNYRTENDYSFDAGWNVDNSIILMPISPKKLLFTQVGYHGDYSVLNKSERFTRLFRKMIIEHAHRYLYSRSRQNGIGLIKTRRVNLKRYIYEKDGIENWHKNQTEYEREIYDKNKQKHEEST